MNRPTDSACLHTGTIQPHMPDGTLMVPVNDPVDAIYTERQPSEAVDRHSEAVMLDRLFWFSIAVLMVVGVGLRIWAVL
ncbi:MULTISPECIES: hypothetical protein [Bremerella]|uniref:hypothetical protein n=1 Tax=Bremerella TaxID=2714594 RepID=UPI0031EF71D2